jgi:diacylglycerol kinase (ATP)
MFLEWLQQENLLVFQVLPVFCAWRTDGRAMRACIIFNPTARGDKARRLLRRLEQLERKCSLKPTFAAGAARQLASEAVREGYETIVAAGGDGTVNEVLNGIADEPDGFSRTRLGVMPVGTVNVFARELGLPSDLRQAWATIARGRTIAIDLPQVHFRSGQDLQRRFFAQMAGCGFDARVVSLVNWELKKKLGKFAFAIATLQALRTKLDMITVSDGARSYSGQLVLLGNGRFYAGSFPLFDRADLSDGKIDVCVFSRINWLILLRYGCAYLCPRWLFRGAEQYFQAQSLRLESAPSTLLEIDGETVGCLPATCQIWPRVLRVIVP